MSDAPTESGAGAEAATPAPVGLWRRLAPKLAISVVLGLLFAYIVHRGGVPFLPHRESLARVAWWAVPAYLVTLVTTHFLRASRWRHLIAPYKRVSVLESVAVNWVGFFAIFAMPLRLGELARPAICKIRQSIPVSVGLGTVAVERVIDGLVTSVFLVVGLFAIPRRVPTDYIAAHLPYYGYLALGIFCCAFVAIGAFLWKRDLARRLTERVFGIVSPRVAGRLAATVDGVAEGLRSLAHLRTAGPFVVETLGYWFCNAFGMWILLRGVGLDVGFGVGASLMGVLAIGILLPAGPGMFGSFQAFLAAGLRLYVDERHVSDEGAAYVFLLYVVQALFMTLTGVIPLYAMKLSFRDLLGPPPDK